MNRALLRQLKRMNLSIDKAPKDLVAWNTFIHQVSESYKQSEEDRYLLERSLEISSGEMSERLKKNKELSLQLMQASKLASLGTLAAGIAHELNNPLQGIKGFIEILSKNELDRKTVLSYLDKVNRLSGRMADTVKQLLKLSRKSESDGKTKILVSDAITETYDLLNKQLAFDQIKFEMSVQCKEAFIEAETNQLFTLFQNLFTNSRDAFHLGKSIKEKKLQLKLRKRTIEL